MKVSELKDSKLNYWVAKADQRKVRIIPAGVYPYDDSDTEIFFHQDKDGYLYPGTIGLNLYCDTEEYSPSTDWSLGGPIIEDNAITVTPISDAEWQAEEHITGFTSRGFTYLIAAMRCFVTSKFGEEVDDS